MEPQEYTAEQLSEFKSGTVMSSPELGDALVDTDFLLSPTHGYRYAREFHHAKFNLSPVSSPEFHRKVLERASHNLAVTLGSDPEFFVRDQNGQLLPAFKFLPSVQETGHQPYQPYWDGFQAEYSVQAGDCLELLTQRIGWGIEKLTQKAPVGAKISHESVVEIPREVLNNSDDQHVQLGCMPSYNAYLMKGKRPDDGRKLPIRFAGGHLHFGIADRLDRSKHRDHEVIGAVKMLDATVGLAMVSLAAGWDDVRRREYYGLAGEFRQPTHGLEYRTLSNFWATHPALCNFVYDIGRIAVRLGVRGMRDVVDATDAEVVAAINQTDAKLARGILLRNQPLWKQLLNRVYYPTHVKKSWKAITEGVGVLRIDPTSILKNWTIQPGEGGFYRKWSKQVSLA